MREVIAEQNGLSSRTLYRYEAAYRKSGFSGLKPQDRETKRSPKLPENFDELLETGNPAEAGSPKTLGPSDHLYPGTGGARSSGSPEALHDGVSPCSGVFHQDSQRGTVIADIRAVLSVSTPVSCDDLSAFRKDVNGMGTDSHQHLFVCVFRPGRIEMLSIHTDFAITIRFQPFIPADIEPFWRQHQERFPVLFKQFPDRDLFLIMEFGSFLFMAGEQLLVILLYLIEMRNRDKQVRTVIINLRSTFPFSQPE